MAVTNNDVGGHDGIDRSRYSQQEAARITVHNAAYGSKATTVERSRVQQEAKLAITNNDVGGHDGKEAARVKAHYAAYGREWTEEEKRKLTEHQESNQLTDCPVSGVKCEWGNPPCFKIDGKTFCLEQGQANDKPGEQLVSVADADLDMSPAADVRPAAERPYVVYFIQAKGGDGECKVGITYSLQSRLRSLQTGNPHELEAVHTIQVDNKATAERIEEAVLNAIKNAGADMKGEWFQSAILPWAQQVADTERKRIESWRF